ncbi:Sac2 family-domain-containing protein [Zychaea mexicana]|uniref:Sac2 family-domain-containing protein n=1 Tax=Zychaea mexicana TaxID=64656 RepID=UPI0022FF15AC|nr:Sac2 family-domain-containing protein [Zychaea mexicana]KAI9497981.1 Sac2 family-domain-containing protein [Zychaea mexicana]
MDAAGSNTTTNNSNDNLITRQNEELRRSIDKALPSVPSSDEDLSNTNKPAAVEDDDSDDDKPLRPAVSGTSTADGPSTTLKELEWLFEEEDPADKDNASLEDDFLDDDFDQITFDEVDDRISAFQEDAFVREALEKGMDLREYALQIEEERESVQRDLENDYVQQIRSFVELHSEVQSCDEVLGRMEELLSVFQSDLGNISGEIKSLQERSSRMSVKLRNRKGVETKLSKALQGMVIPPYSIKKITEGEVDEVWLQYLLAINQQMRFVKANQNKPIKALRNVGPELEKLRLKAASTIRDFFIERINALLVPNTNVQIMQQSVFLKYKELHQFVIERHHDAATEIRQTYVNALKWYFNNHFERYSKGLTKLQARTDKSDLIGVEEHGRKGLFSSTKVALKDKTNVFALGDRIDALKMTDQGVILVHVAEDKDQKFQFEQLFRSFNLTLIDNASSEYLFIYEFFSSRDTKKSADTAKSVFQQIFDPTEKVGLTFTKGYIENSYDAVGILLCIRINTQLALELQRRRVPALEGYTNSTNMTLWPRFQHVMTLHVESLKRMAATKSVISAVKDIHPHYITRRYAEFAASLLVLNEGYDDAILINSVQKMRNEFEGLLARMSNEFSEPTRRIAFLINNYDVIVSVFQEAHNRALESELEHVRQLLSIHTGAFVDEQLKPFFGSMVDCVKRSEQSKNMAQPEKGEMQRISHEFAQTWRQSLTSINSSVIQYFSNFKNGTMVLHAVLGQLIVYYTKFLDILEQRGISGVQPVGVQTVMVEIKKFRSTF